MCVVARKPEIEHLVGEDSGDGCMQGRYYAMPEDLKWKDMLKNHLTTCAEDPLKSRSDCHAWVLWHFMNFRQLFLVSVLQRLVMKKLK